MTAKKPAVETISEESLKTAIAADKEEKARVAKFIAEYNALCDKLQVQLVAEPGLVITNHNTYELTVQLKIAPVKKQ